VSGPSTQRPSLADLLLDHPFGDDAGLLYTSTSVMTAGAARADARTIAGQLQALGIQPGQAVAVRLPNGPGVVTAMTGVWLAGAVFVPINPRLPAAASARVVAAVEPAAVITSEGTQFHPGGRRLASGSALVLWTSGTTGAPKPIVHTHAAYLELLDRVLGPLRGGGGREPTRAPTPNLIPISLALNAGLYNVLFGLRAGAPIVIMDEFRTVTFADLVRRFDVRSTVLPPAAMAMLSDDPDIDELTPLKYVRSITAPLSPLQARRFAEKFGVFVLNSYGQAELGEVIGWTAADAREFPDKLGAAGRPHPGVSVKVVSPSGRRVPVGQTGALFVRPPSMASGSAVAGDDLSERIDREGFVDTGDLARVDPEGFVWIEGRASDVINRGGNKVFPAEVEEVLRLSAAVTDAAVVGVPDARLGEVPVAFVTGGGVLASELTNLCRGQLAPYKIPVAFHLVDRLPRNEAGKVLRSELVELHRRPVGERRPRVRR
jgi:acyl-CoA synthetase (AMP-forming)/AMP-acid ligase II